ncbi:MAG: phenylacetate--CoA ligase family protein, partial [Rhodobacteraceae bacterium]|nr:phenylacetate--CoA ligase family protein [Paracoccaceae bacterium]
MPVKLGLDTPQSAVPGIDWPSIPAPAAASQLAVQWQLDHSQWWPLPRLRGYQLLQLRGLLAHAYRTIPWYQQHWSRAAYEPGAELEWDLFHRLPLLTRTDIQTAGNALHSRGIPPEHGQVRHRSTSGSTGTPVHAWATDISQLFTTAFTLRDHCWHRRDLSARLAVIHTLADGRTG